MIDPLKFKKLLWPDVQFYKQQEEIIYSVVYNDETVVVAGNKLGKDFVAAFIVLWFFITHHPVRVITTSVKADHLRVLWGEIGEFIRKAKFPLTDERGGPLVCNHYDIRKIVKGERCPISYLRGMVSEKGEGMAGHHAKHTLLVIDEASGVDDVVYTQGDTWAAKKLIFGNPMPCQNFFYDSVKKGDVRKDNGTYYRRVIRIRAEDSPNVRYAFAQKRLGIRPDNRILIPGLLSWDQYLHRRRTWDKVRQCIGLDAEFYEGAEVLMFPPEWLNQAEQLAERLKRKRRFAKAIGVDTGEGEADTCWAIVDEKGLIKLISQKTPDTSVITGRTIALMEEYDVDPEYVVFDRGGGGKEHADRLRAQGYDVSTVAFGESASDIADETGESRTTFKNRRAQLYWLLRERLNPEKGGFAIPACYTELRRQLSLIPLQWDEEGRLVLPPKTNTGKSANKKTLIDIIGRSPDQADALVAAVYGLTLREHEFVVDSLI